MFTSLLWLKLCKVEAHLSVSMSDIVLIHLDLLICVVWWFCQWSLKDH